VRLLGVKIRISGSSGGIKETNFTMSKKYHRRGRLPMRMIGRDRSVRGVVTGVDSKVLRLTSWWRPCYTKCYTNLTQSKAKIRAESLVFMRIYREFSRYTLPSSPPSIGNRGLDRGFLYPCGVFKQGFNRKIIGLL
jgi:hypothetical protein